MKARVVIGNGAVVEKGRVNCSGIQNIVPFNSVLRAVADKLPPNKRIRTGKLSRRPSTARFTDEQVRLMRDLYARGVLPSELSLLLEMNADCIRSILSGKNYSGVI